MYARLFYPSTLVLLEKFEEIRTLTGMLGENLQRAYDDWMLGIRTPIERNRVDETPQEERRRTNAHIADIVRKLRAKGQDKGIPLEEAVSFLDKADELESRYL